MNNWQSERQRSMNTRADEQASQADTGPTLQNSCETPMPTGTLQQTNGRNDLTHELRPIFRRRATPSSFKTDETLEEREARIRDALAMLDSLRAKTSEEEAEQRETWEYLKATLDANRPVYAKLFPDE
jgi:hypothetical protein